VEGTGWKLLLGGDEEEGDGYFLAEGAGNAAEDYSFGEVMAMGRHCQEVVWMLVNFINDFCFRFSASDKNSGFNTCCLEFFTVAIQYGEGLLAEVAILIEGMGVDDVKKMQGGAKLKGKRGEMVENNIIDF